MTRRLHGESILVTGGAGFIGSEVVSQLIEANNDVTVLDNFITGSIENLQDVVSEFDETQIFDDSINLISGDIRHVDLDGILETNNIDYVIHLAAEPFIPSSYDRPEEFFSVNANGTLRLLTACQEKDIERVLVYSSSEIYGTAQTVPMDETHRMYPQSTYAASKLAADRLCFTLHHEQNIPVIILRQFNCYGPRETHPYIVPEVIKQFSESNDVNLGNTEASRDLTYVSDAVRGALKLINCPDAEGEVVNLGFGDDFTVKELAEKIGDLMGHDEVNIHIESERFRPLDVERLQCDYSKAVELIDYEPEISLREGLVRTIDWYHRNGPWVWENTLEDKLWEEL